MARTRSRALRPSDRPAYRSPPQRPQRRRPGLRIDLRPLVRPLALLILAGLAIAAAAATLLVLIPAVTRGVLSLLGAGTPVLLAGILLCVWGCHELGTGSFLRRFGRFLAGGSCLFLGALGIAALFRPANVAVFGVSAQEASLGGLLGQVIVGEPGWEAGLRISGFLLGGMVLVYPRVAPLALRGLRLAIAHLIALRLPQRAWGFVKSRRAGASPPPLALPIADDQPFDEPPPDTSPVQSTMLPIIEPPDEEEPPVAPAWNRWEMPGLTLLEQTAETEPIDQTQRAKHIEEALASYGVEGKVVQIHVGPAVTQFGIEPGWDRKYKEIKERAKDGTLRARTEEVSRTRVKVERITALSNNLALALAAQSVRIEAPVPGKQVVGIEVPNVTPDLVPVRGVIESAAFQRLRNRSKLALALGKGVAGDVVVADLAKMPHLLIAGATGSGKSVCINSIVCCILMHASPDEIRFLMVDPKRVELVPYNDIPHLLAPVIVDADKVVGTLQWVIHEMEERYKKFASVGVRNIEGFNRSPKVTQPMPYWVLVIDELADLMMVAPYEVEKSLCRLAQLARATGIHLVVATQRPSVDVITGLIKANFPTRISFAVTSHIDSRTILDASGAEKLLGRGDMLYMATDAAKPRRVQGTYVSDAEVERLVSFWADDRFRLLRPEQHVEEIQKLWAASSGGGSEDGEADPLLERARELAETSDRLSTSFLQRRLRIGYPRAARIMEALRDEGYGEIDEDF